MCSNVLTVHGWATASDAKSILMRRCDKPHYIHTTAQQCVVPLTDTRVWQVAYLTITTFLDERREKEDVKTLKPPRCVINVGH